MIIERSSKEALGEPLPRSVSNHPAFLDAATRACYKKIRPVLDAMGITAASLSLVACYCQACCLARAAYKMTCKEGHTLRSAKGGSYLHPSVGVWKQACDHQASYSKLLGIMPNSVREKIGELEAEEAQADAPARLVDFTTR